MFRASSEIAVDTRTRSVAGKPHHPASSRPFWRGAPTSLSGSMGAPPPPPLKAAPLPPSFLSSRGRGAPTPPPPGRPRGDGGPGGWCGRLNRLIVLFRVIHELNLRLAVLHRQRGHL